MRYTPEGEHDPWKMMGKEDNIPLGKVCFWGLWISASKNVHYLGVGLSHGESPVSVCCGPMFSRGSSENLSFSNPGSIKQ